MGDMRAREGYLCMRKEQVNGKVLEKIGSVHGAVGQGRKQQNGRNREIFSCENRQLKFFFFPP